MAPGEICKKGAEKNCGIFPPPPDPRATDGGGSLTVEWPGTIGTKRMWVHDDLAIIRKGRVMLRELDQGKLRQE